MCLTFDLFIPYKTLYNVDAFEEIKKGIETRDIETFIKYRNVWYSPESFSRKVIEKRLNNES